MSAQLFAARFRFRTAAGLQGCGWLWRDKSLAAAKRAAKAAAAQRGNWSADEIFAISDEEEAAFRAGGFTDPPTPAADAKGRG